MNRKLLFLFMLLLLSNGANAQAWQWAAHSNYGSSTSRTTAADKLGNVYIAGEFHPTANFGNVMMYASGYNDIFLVKYSTNGSYLWSKAIGTATGGSDYAHHLFIDNDNNIYLVGSTTSSDTVLVIDNYTIPPAASPYQNKFIVKFNPFGNVIWGKRMSGDFTIDNITGDTLGNIYLSVITSYPGPASFDNLQLNSGDYYLVKMNSAGNFVWAIEPYPSCGGGPALAIGPANDIFVAGCFGNCQLIDSTTLYNNGLFIRRYSAAGILKSSFDYPNNNGACIRWMAIKNEHIYVSGSFDTLTIDSITIAHAGTNDIFLAAFDTAGNLNWMRSAGGPDFEELNGLALDPSGNPVMTGCYKGAATFANTVLPAYSYLRQMFVCSYDTLGNLLWAKRQGVPSETYSLGIASHPDGIVVAGIISNTNSFGNTTLPCSGNSAFVAKMCMDSVIFDLGPTIALCPSCTITLNAGMQGVSYLWHPNNQTTSSISVTAPGVYAVAVTGASGCVFTDTVKVIAGTGVAELDEQLFTISPNPSAGKFTISTGDVKIDQLHIHDMRGRKVFTENNFSSSTDHVFDLTLAPGVYLVSAVSGDFISRQKLVIH